MHTDLIIDAAMAQAVKIKGLWTIIGGKKCFIKRSSETK